MQQLKLINPSETIAILIGVSEFEDFFDAPPIKNNVSKLASLLQDDSVLGLDKDRILVFDQKESNGVILRKIRSFINDNFADTVIFYFAGHGYKTKKGDFYLVTHNANKEDIELTSIPWNKIKNILEKGAGIKQRIYILDACHSGAAALGEDDDETQIAAGSALIAAAKADEKAYFKTDDKYTHFTNALINILEKGIHKTDVASLNTNTLFDHLQAALSDEKFEITKKTTHEIEKVSFFKNKGFDQLGGKRKEIQNLIKEGDDYFKNLNFQSARRAYLDAKHEAGGEDKFQKLFQQIETKIKENDAIKKYKTVFEAHFKKQLKEKENELVELKNSFKNTAQDLETIQQKIKIQQKQAATDEKSIAQLQGTKKQLEKDINTTNEALIKALADIKQQKNCIDQLEKENEQLKKDLKSLKNPPKPKTPTTKDNTITQKIGNTSFEMIFVKGGSFKMGKNTINMPDYYMAKYPVTQKLWREVMGNDPSHFKGDDRPVEQVSWDDAQQFIEKINAMTGEKYRLPNESEWEFSARGGTLSKGFEYAGSNSLEKVAWYDENSNKETHPVGQKQANELGLYDMSGNVWEWCEDVWMDDTKKTPLDGSSNNEGDQNRRVIRGGSWSNVDDFSRVSYRIWINSGNRFNNIGFRFARY